MAAEELVSTPEDEERELALEDEAVQVGVDRYRSKLREAVTGHKDLTKLAPETDLLRRSLEPLIDYIKQAKKAKKSTRFGKATPFISLVDNETLAYITGRFCVNLLAHQEPLQRSSIRLGEEVRLHLEYVALEETISPRLLAVIEKDFARKGLGPQSKKETLKTVAEKHDVPKYVWDEEIKLLVGNLLIDGFIASTGFLRIVDLASRNKKGAMKGLVATKEVQEWLKEAHDRCELMAPMNLPMIVPPKPWEAVVGGGYLSARGGRRLKLVRTRCRKALDILRDEADLSSVYRAINALQNTAWRINPFIHSVLEEVFNLGGGFAGIPIMQLEPELPPKMWTTDEEYAAYKEEHPEEYAEWRATTIKAWADWQANTSKRSATCFKLWLANKFSEEKAIYMPWTCDWRGRLYPAPQYVNPQADDSGKALLEFAKGKRLGERGIYWLAIHGANCFGVDKVSYDERIQWVKDNEEGIKDSALSPVDGSRFWVEADDPFKFLAFCKEWQGVLEEGEDFISHIPVALDGSSNGLQHFSALLRDERGGKAVCLVPSEKPADIYQEVADVTNEIIEEDCLKGDELALMWRGKVTRKITKRNTMTTPYGVSAYGRVEQLLEVLKKEGDILEGINHKMVFQACRYLAEVNGRAIARVVQASKAAMGWLQDTAKKVSGPITWTTPSGFMPHQEYKKVKAVRIKTYWGKNRIDLTLAKDTTQEDVQGNVNGMSPNFIHSLDAAHCIMTINKCLDAGLDSFSMIHDSYATYASDTDELAKLLREAFVELHSKPLLEQFRQEVMDQTGIDLLPVPVLPEASLELDRVKESLYFFS